MHCHDRSDWRNRLSEPGEAVQGTLDHQLTRVQPFSSVLLSQRVSQVLVWAWHHWAVSKVSEMRISLLVALAHTSLRGCHGAGVNGHVERAGVLRDLGRNRRSGNGEQSK